MLLGREGRELFHGCQEESVDNERRTIIDVKNTRCARPRSTSIVRRVAVCADLEELVATRRDSLAPYSSLPEVQLVLTSIAKLRSMGEVDHLALTRRTSTSPLLVQLEYLV